MYTRSILKTARVVASRIFVVSAAAAMLAVGSHQSFAADAKKPAGPMISKKVTPPLKAANDAYTAKQYDVALSKLQEADSAEGKTPYDQFRIDELRALSYINLTKFAEALAIYEKHEETSKDLIEPQLAEIRPKVMTQLAFRIQAHDKVLKYGKQWLAAHADDTGVLDLMARSSYIGKDYKAALESAQTAISIAETNGKVPDELWLQLLSSCSSSLNDPKGMMAGYEKLVRYYPKPEHWKKTSEALLSYEQNDAAQLHILRLMADTGSLSELKRSEYFMEYSQRAIDKAVPGEAAKALQVGFDKNVLGAVEKDKAAQQRALTEAQDKAKKDKAQLPEIEKEVKASKATNGNLEAGLGLAYFSHQMYEQAVPMLESGIAKGGLRNLDDTRMVLGIAYIQVGQKEKAREEFKKASANATLAKVAPFWISRSYN